jgi:hypothetical protein
MANVTRISCIVNTHADPGSGAGTDAAVFLGMGGREFRLDAQGTDFERGAVGEEYTLGDGANIRRPQENDPRQPSVLKTTTLDRFPVYFRYRPQNSSDHWRLRGAVVFVYRGDEQLASAYVADVPAETGILLGRNAGEILHLRKGASNERAALVAATTNRSVKS